FGFGLRGFGFRLRGFGLRDLGLRLGALGYGDLGLVTVEGDLALHGRGELLYGLGELDVARCAWRVVGLELGEEAGKPLLLLLEVSGEALVGSPEVLLDAFGVTLEDLLQALLGAALALIRNLQDARQGFDQDRAELLDVLDLLLELAGLVLS